MSAIGMPWNMETIRFLTQRIVFSILCNNSMGSCILHNAYLVKNQVAAIGSAIGSLYLLNQCCINERNPMLLKVWQFTFFPDRQLERLRASYAFSGSVWNGSFVLTYSNRRNDDSGRKEFSKKGFKIGQTRAYSAGERIVWIVEKECIV